MFLQVVNSSNSTVASQLNPVFKNGKILEDQFQLVFVVTLPALGEAHYLVSTGTKQMVKADIQYINHAPPARYVRVFHEGDINVPHHCPQN